MLSDNGRTGAVIALAGFMYSGKSSVGRILAAKTGAEFFDLDEIIEKNCSLSITEIFSTRGEAFFRKAEKAAIAELLASPGKGSVIALGGGAFEDPGNAEALLEKTELYFLKVPFAEIERRRSLDDRAEKRPLAADPEEFRRLYEKRLETYSKIKRVVECGTMAPGPIAEKIIGELEKDGLCSKKTM